MGNKKSVLITGINGLLGVGLTKTLPSGIEIIKTHHKNNQKDNSSYLDITDKESIAGVFSKNVFDSVIHTASIGNVDECEKDKEFAYKVNVQGTRNLIEACEKYNKHLIYISTNAVFSGDNAPYSEADKKNPVNYYGETKSISEDEVLNSKISSAIVRLVLMYGWNNEKSRQNPVTWLLDKLKNQEKVLLVNDTYVNPVYNLQAADAIWKLLQAKKTGIFHVAGETSLNRYELGIATAKVFGLDASNISPVDSSYFPSIAKRMPNTTYDLTKIKKEIGYIPLSIENGLKLMMGEKK